MRGSLSVKWVAGSLAMLWVLFDPVPETRACMVRQANLTDVVDHADALVVAEVISFKKTVWKGNIPATHIRARVSIREVVAGQWKPEQSEIRHTRHKAHRRRNKLVCPLHTGSGLELKLREGRRYLLLLERGNLDDSGQLLRAEPLVKRPMLEKLFKRAATRVRNVKAAVWTWDMCNNRVVQGKQPPLSCVTSYVITPIEPEGDKSKASIHKGRFGRFVTDVPVEWVRYKGSTIGVYWCKAPGKPQEIFVEAKREGVGTVELKTKDADPIVIRVEVKPSVMGLD